MRSCLPLLAGLMALAPTPTRANPTPALPSAPLPSAAPARGPAPGPSSAHKVRGMTVSCPTDGVEWGTPWMDETLDELQALGVSWIAIHPYAGVRDEGGVDQWRRLALSPPPAWVRRPIEEAHRRGIKVLVTPHLGYWGSRFSWRGDVAFETPEQWARFFAEYEAWITEVASVSTGADAFAIGNELDRTLGHEAEWRRTIAAVRRRFSGPITYGANWSDYQKVPFWDALDIIGVQAYFPLVSGEAEVTEAALRAGWARHLAELDAFARARDRYVVFTELGYNHSARAAAAPWAYETGGPDAEGVQLRALEVALDVVRRHDRVVGAFLWKWYPGPREPRDFSMEAPAIRALLTRYWRE